MPSDPPPSKNPLAGFLAASLGQRGGARRKGRRAAGSDAPPPASAGETRESLAPPEQADPSPSEAPPPPAQAEPPAQPEPPQAEAPAQAEAPPQPRPPAQAEAEAPQPPAAPAPAEAPPQAATPISVPPSSGISVPRPVPRPPPRENSTRTTLAAISWDRDEAVVSMVTPPPTPPRSTPQAASPPAAPAPAPEAPAEAPSAEAPEAGEPEKSGRYALTNAQAANTAPRPTPKAERQSEDDEPALHEAVRGASTFAWLVSLLLHGAGLGGGALLVARMATAPTPAMTVELKQPEPPPPDDGTMEIELPPMRELSTVYSPSSTSSSQAATPPHPSGGDAMPRPDQQQAGLGGTLTVNQPALNLADHDDGLLLSKDMISRLDRSQVQRLRSSEERASMDDRRATWKPMEVTFLVSGKGSRPERRPLAESDPSRGARMSDAPGVLGGSPGARPLNPGEGETPRVAGNAAPGINRASPGRGVLDGAEGNDHRESADSTFARPMITEGRPAVPAFAVDKPRDNADADQEVASLVQSLLHASTLGGKQGEGPGGETGPGRPGAGGQAGPGATSRALGQGPGSTADSEGTAIPLAVYSRSVFSKIDRLWANAFPQEAALQGRQGIAIIGFTILANGTVSGAYIARPSGVPEFDENVRRAVLRAAPFPPLPVKLGKSLSFRLSFDAKNPAVR